MPSPIVTATLQAAVLSATSNILAQILTAYQTDVRPVFYSLLDLPHSLVLWAFFWLSDYGDVLDIYLFSLSLGFYA